MSDLLDGSQCDMLDDRNQPHLIWWQRARRWKLLVRSNLPFLYYYYYYFYTLGSKDPEG